MAVNEERDLRSELLEGYTDGKVMKLGGGMRGGCACSLKHDAARAADNPRYTSLGLGQAEILSSPLVNPR